MGVIFRNAANVVIWLGGERNNSGEAMCAIKELVDDLQMCSDLQRVPFFGRVEPPIMHGKLSLHAPLWTDIDRLLSRAWFSRVWTLQEAALAVKCEVRCGDKVLPFSVLQKLYEGTCCSSDKNWARAAQKMVTLKSTNSEISQRHFGAHMSVIQVFKQRAESRWTPHVAFFLNKLESCGASIEKDRIYSVYAALGGDIGASLGPLNYSEAFTATDLFQALSESQLERCHSLEFLGAAGVENQRKDFEEPTWVADWAYHSTRVPL